MNNRSSYINKIDLKGELQLSSVIQIGDAKCVNGNSYALAVHREEEFFHGSEGDLNHFSAFTIPIPFESSYLPSPSIIKLNECNKIQVNTITMLGVSSSSVVQMGNTRDVEMETRIHHVRHSKGDDYNTSNYGTNPNF